MISATEAIKKCEKLIGAPKRGERIVLTTICKCGCSYIKGAKTCLTCQGTGYVVDCKSVIG